MGVLVSWPCGDGERPPQALSRADCQAGRSAATNFRPMTAGSGLIYALGQIEAHFLNEPIEKELTLVSGGADTAGLSDREMTQAVLSSPEYAYLARQLCWVLTIKKQVT